jgi:hypothetical protein
LEGIVEMPTRVEAEELAWIAQSYLNAAEQLVRAVIDQESERDAYWTRPPLYLSYHGVELYYKAALAAAGTPYRKEHNLLVLRKACAHIPDCAFPLPTWLGGELHRMGDLFEDDVPRLYFEHLHQQLRYVTDRKGRPLQPPLRVVATDLAEEISELKRVSMPILLRIAMNVHVNGEPGR